MKTLNLILAISITFYMVSCKIIEIKKLEKEEIFTVENNKNAIILNGVINSTALEKFKFLAIQYPNLKRIEIVNCDGSINDEVNLKLSKYIYDNNYDIHLLDNGLIASGGTDLFLAGQKRSKGNNTSIGVHSWAGDNATATDFPTGNENHLPYINYYVSVGFTEQQAEDFYNFTIYAAPADSMHWMTNTEISLYNITTQ